MTLAILNGPNLNLLGEREPSIYGRQSFGQYFSRLCERYPHHQLVQQQENEEGKLVAALQHWGAKAEGIILNPAAFSHTSIAVADAVAALKIPVVEVHISNLYRREGFRQQSYVSAYAAGLISGLGLHGYALAVEWFGMQGTTAIPD